MDRHWVYEVRNVQTAWEACLAIDRAYTPDEVTGLAVFSREGSDDRDHLYVDAVSKNPPQGRISGVDEILDRFGHRVALTEDDLLDPHGLQFLAFWTNRCHPGRTSLALPGRDRVPPTRRHPADLLGGLARPLGVVSCVCWNPTDL